jgi:hypothetical protein
LEIATFVGGDDTVFNCTCCLCLIFSSLFL